MKKDSKKSSSKKKDSPKVASKKVSQTKELTDEELKTMFASVRKKSNELKQITWREFFACKNLGRKRWYEFQEALSEFYSSESAVTFIRTSGLETIHIEIDVSKPFGMVVRDLAAILNSKL